MSPNTATLTFEMFNYARSIVITPNFSRHFALPNFNLRSAQAHVLREYSGNFTSSPDTAIELPTGAGKT